MTSDRDQLHLREIQMLDGLLALAREEIRRLRGSIERMLTSLDIADGHDPRLLLIDLKRWLRSAIDAAKERGSG